MKLSMIINPKAGASARHRLNLLQVAPVLAGHQLVVQVPRNMQETDAIAWEAVDSGYDRILAVGGDGTINGIISALAGSGIPLGIIPTGTVNVLARELGVPLDPLRALETAITGVPRRIDLGDADGKVFSLMAGLGFDAEVIAGVDQQMKDRFGPLAYIAAGLQALTRHTPRQFHLVVDGKEITFPAWLLVVGNASYYAYEMTVVPQACIDDGLLDLVVFAEESALDRVAQLGAVFVGQHIHHPNVRHFRARAVTVQVDSSAPIQLDGELVGNTPVHFTVRAGALTVMVPESPYAR